MEVYYFILLETGVRLSLTNFGNCRMSLRNIYAHKDDPAGWMAATSRFDNHVPRFDSKQSCIDFVKANCQAYSNPSEPGMMHSVSTLTSWSQIEQYVFPKVREYNKRFGPFLASFYLVAFTESVAH